MSTSDYYYSTATTSTAGYAATAHSQPIRKSRSLKSENDLVVQGPLEVQGSIKSERSITLNGDFSVAEKMEAYGALEINGNVNCGGKIKAVGNIKVTGYLVTQDKMKGFGKLRILGNVDAQDVEVYGDTTINGFLKCRNLTLYGSLTLIGQESGYYVEGTEQVWGSKIVRESNPDW